MSEPSVLYEEQGAVALVTLNRPANLNSLNAEMHRSEEHTSELQSH